MSLKDQWRRLNAVPGERFPVAEMPHGAQLGLLEAAE